MTPLLSPTPGAESQCWTCRTPLIAAAAANPAGPDWSNHPGCEPTSQCPCSTPWDPPPPFLLLGDSGPFAVTRSYRIAGGSDTPQPGLLRVVTTREAAEMALAAAGLQLADKWRQGRYRKQPAWLSRLVDGRDVTLVVPVRLGSGGYHCVGCHLDFASFDVAKLHQPVWGGPCRDPLEVLHVLNGRPLMVRVDGVWGLDRSALWGLAR